MQWYLHIKYFMDNEWCLDKLISDKKSNSWPVKLMQYPSPIALHYSGISSKSAIDGVDHDEVNVFVVVVLY